MSKYEKYPQDYPLDALFPPYLERGSTGPAVSVLHIFLVSHGYNDPRDPIAFDGKYGAITEAAVQRLQETIGITGDDVDGKLGPATRIAVVEHYGLDFSQIPMVAFANAETTWIHNGEEQGSWATDEEDAQNQINALLHSDEEEDSDEDEDPDENEDEDSDGEDPEDGDQDGRDEYDG